MMCEDRLRLLWRLLDIEKNSDKLTVSGFNHRILQCSPSTSNYNWRHCEIIWSVA